MKLFLYVATLLALFKGFKASLTCYDSVTAAFTCDDWGCPIADKTTLNAAGTAPKCKTTATWLHAGVGTVDPYDLTTETAAAPDTTLCDYGVTTADTFTCVTICDSASACNDAYTTTAAATATSCVQCTSEDDTSGTCYLGTTASSTCDSTNTDLQYCVSMHAVTLTTAGVISHQVAFRGCADQDYGDGCWTDSVQVDSNTDSAESVVICSKTCSGGGCNTDAFPMTLLKGNGKYCNYCSRSATNPTGCDTLVPVTCLDGENYCSTTVYYTDGNYYHDKTNAADDNYGVVIISEERGCATTAVTTSCASVSGSTDLAGSNLDVIKCEETCTGDECNKGWPMRPMCSQCEGRIWDEGATAIYANTVKEHLDYCKLYPPEPEACPDPSYTHCYVSEKFIADGDNDITWGYSSVFERGCLHASEASDCTDYHWRDEREAHYCKFVCNEDYCNLGSPAMPITLSAGSLIVAYGLLHIN